MGSDYELNFCSAIKLWLRRTLQLHKGCAARAR